MTGSPQEVQSSDVALIAVRGTTEPQSGSRLLMPVGELISAGLTVPTTYTELDYPADFEFAASVPHGVDTLVRLLNDAASEYPERRHVLMGYSQGAWVIGEALVAPTLRDMGRAAPELSAAAASRVAAVLFYGDPRFTAGEPFNAGTFEADRQSENPRPVGQLAEYADRMQNYCAVGDIACQGNGGTYVAHLAYLTNSMREEGATFALGRLGAHQPTGDRT
ncbi:cutinase family protein [Streptomyces sp. WMMC1477]|uniref:cutinase family protein n=1 Tax=Streptomyces sp. WMMC1477 TaxID=3015155 RepID=UPI0022B6D09A|nr:cutinase family protein [Streptomyces sp. WMMC1477]MCZ7431115.1 cutinase family protein [Streptomyces sp. WMMC1477]